MADEDRYRPIFDALKIALTNAETEVIAELQRPFRSYTNDQLMEIIHFVVAPGFALKAHLDGKINVYDFPELAKLVLTACVIWECPPVLPNGVASNRQECGYGDEVTGRAKLTWEQLDAVCGEVLHNLSANEIIRFTDPQEYAKRVSEKE